MMGPSVLNSADRAAGRPMNMVPTLTMPGARGIVPPLTPVLETTPQLAPPPPPPPLLPPDTGHQPAALETTTASTLPPPTKNPADAEAHATLNSVTEELQKGRILHADASARFTALISTLPVGKLRCSALLNRAHCLVGMGQYSDALADIDSIISERTPGVDAYRWPKVWMSRGGIHRKLAQAAEAEGKSSAELYARARADYERVLAIEPRHEDAISKARRCLEQLDVLERRSSDANCGAGCNASRTALQSPSRNAGRTSNAAAMSPLVDDVAAGAAATAATTPPPGRSDDPQRRSSVTPDNMDTRVGLAAQPAAGDGSQEPVIKRRRLGRKSSHDGYPTPEAAGSLAANSTAAHPVRQQADADFAQRGLRYLGRECAAAGRALFEDGAVLERSSATSMAAAEANNLPSTPRGQSRRIFEIRSPMGDHVEVVTLDGGGIAGPTGSVDGMHLGECSCRLRGHCKHMAAVLCAVEREELRGGASGSSGGAAIALARPGDPSARIRRDSLERRLERKTMEELKSLLRANNQLLGGTKGELLRRVADGVIFGALPQCPTCKGHLHPEALTSGDSPGIFRCRKLNRDKEHCGYEVRAEDVLRRPFIGADQLA